MNSKELDNIYGEKKVFFHSYLDKVRKSIRWNLYAVVNPTLTKNPYRSYFPLSFFTQKVESKNKLKLLFNFYKRNMYFFIAYVVAYFLYRIYYRKNKNKTSKVLFDVFLPIDRINNENKFTEHYFGDIYKVFSKYKRSYTIVPRLYGINKNPFKLISFFKIINKSNNNFLFEYELLKINDFFFIFIFLVKYPFKIFGFKQKKNSKIDEIFNQCLINDLEYFSFPSLTKYIAGKNISKLDEVEKIYSWSEYQAIDRGFNYGIRKHNNNIKLIACQFYLNYETYFNTYIDDSDYDLDIASHKVLVNGEYYLRKQKKVLYTEGVSLRYKGLFQFKGIKEAKVTLLLGSYIVNDTISMLKFSKNTNGNFIFKKHPLTSINSFKKYLTDDITVANKDIYELFEKTKVVICTASGTAVEAVSCGISVILLASQDNLTANPLVEYGQGKIWDIAYSKSDIERIYNELVSFREYNIDEVMKIADWYKKSFFIEPTEENIVKAFELERSPN